MAEPFPSPPTEYDYSEPPTPQPEKALGNLPDMSEDAPDSADGGKGRPSRSQHILSRDFFAHVIGDRTSPSSDPLHCLDPVKFSPLEKSGEHLDPCKQ